MPLSNELWTRCAKLARSLTLPLLLLASACVPRSAPVPSPAPPGSAALPAAEPTVRVGVQVEVQSARLSSDRELQLLAPAGGTIRRARPGETITVTADAAGRLRIDGERVPGDATLLTARSRGGAVRVNDRSYRGEIVVQSTAPGALTVVNRVEMEDYLLGVVPREIGRVGPERYEAVKAQAVAARTYAVRYLGRRESLGFDVFATVQDQVYGGVEDEYNLVTRAVRETAGEILVHGGRPIEAYYHSTCAGHTAAIDEVWNSPPIAYLQAVRDVDPRTGQAYDHFSSRFRWTQRWSADELNQILSRTLADSVRPGMSGVGRVRDIQLLERTPSGRIGRMRITTTTGDFVVGGDRIRWIFLTPSGAILNSARFEIDIERGSNGDPVAFVATGGGWGHGIGMCQVGAMGRAEAGQNYRTILQTYYPGAQLVDLY